MPELQWARLQTDVDCHLRRGGWYRVIRLAPLEVLLDVNRKPLSVPRPFLQIAPTPPRRWTVVPRPRRAPRLPDSWGARYGVCPSCRNRMPLDGQPASLRCQRCNGLFEVAWDEAYLKKS